MKRFISFLMLTVLVFFLFMRICGEKGKTAEPAKRGLRTLVLMAYFQDAPLPSLAKDTVDQVVFGNLNNYIREVSYNKASVAGLSTGWLKVPINSPTNVSNYCDGALQSEAIKAAGLSFDLTQFDVLILINDRICATTDWAAIHTAEGTTVKLPSVWVPSFAIKELAASGGVGTLGHEFGHSLGLGHAGSLTCGNGALICQPAGDFQGEYGDSFDIMGDAAPGAHFNAAHKEQLGWLDSSGVLTVTSNGTYTLEPLETATGGLKAIKIPRGMLPGGNGPDYLYVEYRQPIGWDRYVVTGGRALLYILENPTKTLALVSASIAVNSGQPFTDPATGAIIKISDKTDTNDRASSRLVVNISGLRGN